jgi:hypothetical protein
MAEGPVKASEWQGRVLVMTPYTSREGGAEAHIFDLVEALRESDLDVELATVPTGPGLVLEPQLRSTVKLGKSPTRCLTRSV